MGEVGAEQLARLVELLSEATPLPWKDRDEHYICIQGAPAEGERYGDLVTTHTGQIAKQQGQGRNNAALIVAAVNALPALLEAITALSARVEALTQERDRLHSLAKANNDLARMLAGQKDKYHARALAAEAALARLQQGNTHD